MDESNLKTKVVTVRVPKFVVDVIDTLVDKGFFNSRSGFINFAIQSALFDVARLYGIEGRLSDDELEIFLKPELAEDNEEIKRLVVRKVGKGGDDADE